MENNEKNLEKLRENNPFMSSSSPNPWDNSSPDIEQLNKNASENIEYMIQHKSHNPSEPLMGLILGAAGIGKTHMLMRILRRLRKKSWRAVFVSVKAFTNSRRVTQELLSEIITSMKYLHSNEQSQFDMLLSEMMTAYEKKRRSEGCINIEKLDLKHYLKDDMPSLDKTFLRCIMNYLSTDSKFKRADVIEWIREGLDDEDSMNIGLPSRDVNEMTDEACEAAAKKFLTSLGAVAAYSNVTIILCFDELDVMKENKKLIRAWGDTIAFIMNHLSGILPLCFIKPEVWETFYPELNLSVNQRLQTGKIILKSTCSIPQAQQLIQERIKFAFKDEAESRELFQFMISRMGNELRTGLSPRTVIQLANRALTESMPDDTIGSIYAEAYKQIQTQPETWPPNSDHLVLALSAWLESHEGFAVSDGKEKYMTLHGNYKNREFAFIVITSKVHTTVSASLNYGKKFMKEYPDVLCYYISESRLFKPTWNRVKERCKEFQDMGGRIILLDNDSRARWYALTSLINKTDNGDIDIYVSTRPKTASRDDIKSFLRNIKLIPGIFTDTETESECKTNAPESKTVSYNVLSTNLSSIVAASPMKILTAKKAIEILSARKITVTMTELISFLKSNTETFSIIESKNKSDILISLMKKRKQTGR